MPISSTGPVSFSDLQTQFGGTNPISLNEYFLYSEGLGGSLRRETGYFTPGDAGGSVTNLFSRYNYSEDTTSQTSVGLSVNRQVVSTLDSLTTGYCIGGIHSVIVTEIDGLTFANETAKNPTAALATQRYKSASIETNLKGYISGGWTVIDTASSAASSIEGFLFSNESVTSVTATLATATAFHTGISTSNRGYFAGGLNASSFNLNSIQGFRFEDETTYTATSTLGTARRELYGIDGSYSGYLGGGVSTAISNIIDRFVYGNESRATHNATLSAARANPATSSGTTSGIWAAGGTGTGTAISNIDIVVYDTGVVSSTATTLPISRFNHAGFTAKNGSRQIGLNSFRGFNAYRGYFAGEKGFLSTYTNKIDSYQFSNSSYIANTAFLSSAAEYPAAINSNIRAYFAGGKNASTEGLSSITRLQFSDETTASLTATISGRRGCSGVSSSRRGYVGGGSLSGVNSSEIDGIRFDDEAAINPSATLATARELIASVSSYYRGYFAGGSSSSNEIDGIRFDDETATNPSATLATGRSNLGGTSSYLRGYFFGGFTTANSSEIDGIRFDTEAGINPSAGLINARSEVSCVNSISSGYVGGNNWIERFQFSTETSALDSSGMFAPEGSGATQSTPKIYDFNNYDSHTVPAGYFGGGGYTVSEIDGIRFSDNVAINPAAALSQSRYFLASTNSAINGYFTGGATGTTANTTTNIIDRFTFNTETCVSLGSKLVSSRRSLAGTSSFNQGYYFGGISPADSNVSTVDKFNFTTEICLQNSGSLPVARSELAGVSSKTAGYVSGGRTSSDSNSFVKVTYSTDSVATISAVLSVARRWHAGAGSSTKGYFAGGYTSTLSDNVSEIDGIQYSDDTAINPAATLGAARRTLAGVNSSSNAYYAGGIRTVGGNSNAIDRLQFSDETASQLSATLVSAREALAGIQSYSNTY